MAVFDPAHPRHLTPEQRLDELAALLATGVRRLLALHQTPATAPETPPPEPPPESAQNRLDESAASWPHVPRG